MKNQFDAFIDDLRQSHGKNLVSVILYGSAAAGDFLKNRSDYNILIALQRITPTDLQNAHASVREWQKLGHPVPVYFTVSELENSADVFPIEFLQMETARKVIYGRDVLEGLSVSRKFLRHQVEYELRSKLIQLRRKYIPASSSVEGLTRLMAHSLSSFAAVFRALLSSKGLQPPVRKHDVVSMAAGEFGLDLVPFEKIFHIREDNFGATLDEVAANKLFADYLEQIEKVIESVDSIGDVDEGL